MLSDSRRANGKTHTCLECNRSRASANAVHMTQFNNEHKLRKMGLPQDGSAGQVVYLMYDPEAERTKVGISNSPLNVDL